MDHTHKYTAGFDTDFPNWRAEEIPLEVHGGTFSLSVRINNVITLKFTLDSGASHVSIPADVVLTLDRAGTIASRDFIGTQTYILADGSRLPSPQFLLRELQVGNHVVRNVIASVASVEAEPLLGQSFLAKLPRWMIDNTKHALILNDEITSNAVPNGCHRRRYNPKQICDLRLRSRRREFPPQMPLKQATFGGWEMVIHIIHLRTRLSCETRLRKIYQA